MKQPLAVIASFAIVSFTVSIQLSTAEAHDAKGHSTTAELARHGAAGAPGDAGHVDRTVRIEMSDAMRFTPSSVVVARGETIRFEVGNGGAVTHEFVLGMHDDLAAHAEMMKKMPGMAHRAPNMATVRPGRTARIVWRFTRAGRVEFACLQPGHFEAGMRGDVRVVAKRGERAVHAGP